MFTLLAFKIYKSVREVIIYDHNVYHLLSSTILIYYISSPLGGGWGCRWNIKVYSLCSQRGGILACECQLTKLTNKSNTVGSGN